MPNYQDYIDHVFFSYVKENQLIVEKIAENLTSYGIEVWLDKNSIKPGERFKLAIRDAIQKGSFFIACFSAEYNKRNLSYMNEELNEAVEILRMRDRINPWFIPIKINECEIPNWPIGGGETLRDLQYIELYKNWEAGLLRLLTVIRPPKKKLSDKLTIIIPMYNEEGVIGKTLLNLIKKDIHLRYKIIVCDDASEDNSVKEASVFARNNESISIVQKEKNEKKIGAIRSALSIVDTPYILQLDADSFVHEKTSISLDILVERMINEEIVAIGFKIKPFANSLIEKLQQLDYLLFTDSIRRLLNVIVCLVGQGVLWETAKLNEILTTHSGKFEGDDLESTMRALILFGNDRVTFDKSNHVVITTTLKKTVRQLLKQRSKIWDYGLIRTYSDIPSILKHKGTNGAFFRSVFITEILTHPFKILMIPTILLVIFLNPFFPYDEAANKVVWSAFEFINKLAIFTMGLLISTSIFYAVLWLINIGSAIYSLKQSFSHVIKFSTFITIYMATPFITYISITVIFIFIRDPEIWLESYEWFAHGLLFTYLWWYVLGAILIFISSESLREKFSYLLWLFLMPFYYLILFAIARTNGFVKYFMNRS